MQGCDIYIKKPYNNNQSITSSFRCILVSEHRGAFINFFRLIKCLGPESVKFWLKESAAAKLTEV